ncbi:hypothetical protein TNCV_4152141 [Trichonephila clavipes]|nr:hypothetical protein TNCV_4152141 [Trichonephila clavipes]
MNDFSSSSFLLTDTGHMDRVERRSHRRGPHRIQIGVLEAPIQFLNTHFVNSWLRKFPCVNRAVIMIAEWPFLEILSQNSESSTVQNVNIYLRIHVSNHGN